MNIGIDVRCLMEDEISGVGQYTLNLLQEILTLDNYNKYWLFYNSWRPVESKLPKLAGNNVKYVSQRWPNKLFNLGLVLFNQPTLDNQLPAVDIFWVPANNFLAWSKKTTRVITCHDLSWQILPRFYSGKGRLWHRLLKLEKLYQQADIILAVSASTKKDLIALNPSLENKIKVTHLGVKKLAMTSVIKERIRSHYQLPEKFILYIGNIEPRKNLHTVIESFKKIKSKYTDFELVIAGGAGWHKKYYARILKIIESESAVRYLGYIPEPDKLPLLALATIFLYPSFYEGFGLPPLEAMSQGCPVVTSNNSSLPEVVGEAGLLVDPHNVNQVAAAVDKILANDDLRNDLIIKGKARALQFEWSRTAQQMVNIFNSLK